MTITDFRFDQRQRSAFTDGDLDTASPSVVLVRCFDRLDVDLAGALESIATADHETTNRLLGHAQDLVGELATWLDVEAWEHAPALLSIYDYVLRVLAAANVHKDPGPVKEAQRILSEIGDSFRTAAGSEPAPLPERDANGQFVVSTSAPAAPEPAAAARPDSPFGDEPPSRGFSLLA
ncbi:MAG: flagellar export chaperone FliS [Actinomycetota bacterium]